MNDVILLPGSQSVMNLVYRQFEAAYTRFAELFDKEVHQALREAQNAGEDEIEAVLAEMESAFPAFVEVANEELNPQGFTVFEIKRGTGRFGLFVVSDDFVPLCSATMDADIEDGKFGVSMSIRVGAVTNQDTERPFGSVC